MRKARIAIIGTGNIGSDLLVKIQRSPYLECTKFIGRNLNSKGMLFARNFNVELSDKSIDAIVEDPDCCDIVIDATSAAVHRINAPILKKLGKFTIDMTPSQIGEMCIPAINAKESLALDNINLVTCGGQAVVPIAYAISRVSKVMYHEMVSVIASKSAGPGTRDNIDEFTQTTKKALLKFTNAADAKAIITLNPADPPIKMHNTLYSIVENPDMDAIRNSVKQMVEEIRHYVDGYKLTVEPMLEHGRIVTMVTVEGHGDYLPPYSGNLDIINCAAISMAERFAEAKL
ncbi:MAG: acetaldehyde dehydrogenase (acetylating) [Fibrobacter sp.]|nr:acetaldehyde dehydrogenase (acetylating) [Fibrobacter sp.]